MRPTGFRGYDSEPAEPLIVDGRPRCPGCAADLSDAGAVTFPHPSVAHLKVKGGKIHIEEVQAGDVDYDGLQCAACDQRIPASSVEW